MSYLALVRRYAGRMAQHTAPPRRTYSILGPETKEEAVQWKQYGSYVAIGMAGCGGIWQAYRWASGKPPSPPLDAEALPSNPAGTTAPTSTVQMPCKRAVTHVVLLKLKPEASELQKAAIIDGLRALPSKIPEIATYSVGHQIMVVDDGRNATVGLVATFACEDDYKVYAGHPEHVAVIKSSIVPVLAPGGRSALQIAQGQAADWDDPSIAVELEHIVSRLSCVESSLTDE